MTVTTSRDSALSPLQAGLLLDAAAAGADLRAVATGLRTWEPQDTSPRSLIWLPGQGLPAAAARYAAALMTALATHRGCPIVVADRLPVWASVGDLLIVTDAESTGESPQSALLAEDLATATSRGLEIILSSPLLADSDVATALRDRAFCLEQRTFGDPASPLRTIAVGIGIAQQLGMLPGELDTIADILDTDAVSCGPHADAVTNQARRDAEKFTAAEHTLLVADQLAVPVAEFAAAVLATHGRSVGVVSPAEALLVQQRSPVTASTEDDLFYDPFLDPPRAQRLHQLRVLLRSDPTAEVIPVDETLLLTGQAAEVVVSNAEAAQGPTLGGPDRPDRIARLTEALVLAARLRYTAAYVLNGEEHTTA